MEKTIESKPLRMIRAAELVHKVGLTYQHIGRLEAKGEFPKRYCLAARTPAWIESEVDAWLLTPREFAKSAGLKTLKQYRAGKKAAAQGEGVVA